MTMKWKISTLALCTAISFASFNAAAADTVTMAVKGTITPGSCVPTLSAADVDFGTINASTLTAVAPALNQLGSKDVTLSIACSSATVLGITATDARLASAIPLDETTFISNVSPNQSNVNETSNQHTFGLGTSGTTNIGAYTVAMKFSGVTATDGANANLPVDVLSVRASASEWSKSTNGFINALNGTQANMSTFARTGSLTPVAIKTATVPLTVTAAVQAMSKFSNAASGITLDGNATISLVYL